MAPATTMVSGPRAAITYTLNGRSYSVAPAQNLYYVNTIPSISKLSTTYYQNTQWNAYNNIQISGKFDPVVSQSPIFVLLRSAV